MRICLVLWILDWWSEKVDVMWKCIRNHVWEEHLTVPCSRAMCLCMLCDGHCH